MNVPGTEPDNENGPADAPRRRKILMPAALGVLVLGGLAAYGAVYGIGGFDGNQNSGQVCAAAPQTAAKLKPAVTADVAAMKVSRKPLSVASLSFFDTNDAKTSIAKMSGKVLLINLWATWCLPCRKEMPALDKLQSVMGGPNFDVVAINLDTRNPQKPRDFLKEIGVIHLAYFSDPKLKTFEELKRQGRAFGLPVTLLVDRKGCELAAMNGPAEWHSDSAIALIRAAIKVTEEPVP